MASKPRAKIVRYSDALADEIIARITEGEPLREICRDEHMPTWGTVYDWIDARPELEARFARARQRGHDAIAADALKIADTPVQGEEITVKPDGSQEVRRGDMLGHRKLQIETRLKLLAKWDRRYADKMALGGDEEAPPIRSESVVMTAEEAYKRMLGSR